MKQLEHARSKNEKKLQELHEKKRLIAEDLEQVRFEGVDGALASSTKSKLEELERAIT